MPSRRSHTKSHHGCLQCKQRRVKCDEKTPNCDRCNRRQMACSFMDQVPFPSPAVNGKIESHTPKFAPPPVYPTHAASNAPTPASLSDHITSPRSTTSTMLGQQQAFSHLGLELIHYYSTQTYMTLTSKLTAHLVWRDVIFQEGLRHDFLLHALMATAALHKATNHAEDSETHAAYIKVAFSYQNAALAGYIPALNRPNQDNAVALFVLSALLTIWLFGSKKLPEALNGVKLPSSPHFLPQMLRPTAESEPEADFLELLTLVQGINAVVKQTIHWLRDSNIQPLIQPPSDTDIPALPSDIEASFQKLELRIDEETKAQGNGQADRREVYIERLNSLRKVSRSRTILEHDQQVFAWPVTSEAPFVELIRRRDAVALALFIHWAACFRCLDHQWWAKGWSYRLVKDACPLLDSTWSDILAWPRKEVGLD